MRAKCARQPLIMRSKATSPTAWSLRTRERRDDNHSLKKAARTHSAHKQRVNHLKQLWKKSADAVRAEMIITSSAITHLKQRESRTWRCPTLIPSHIIQLFFLQLIYTLQRLLLHSVIVRNVYLQFHITPLFQLQNKTAKVYACPL